MALVGLGIPRATKALAAVSFFDSETADAKFKKTASPTVLTSSEDMVEAFSKGSLMTTKLFALGRCVDSREAFGKPAALPCLPA